MRITTAATWLALATSTLALDQAQISSVFSGQTGLTGATQRLRDFDLTVVTNETHALISLNSTRSPSQVGWMSVGQGSGMGNADYLIAWPNRASDSIPWTLSHRRPNGDEGMPLPAAQSSAQSTQSFYTVLPDLSTTASSPFTAVTYIRLLQPPADYPVSSSVSSAGVLSRASTRFIYASCSASPGNADESATIEQHDRAKGTTTLDLSRPITLASTGTSASGSETSNGAGLTDPSQGWTRRDIILIAHAVTGSLALIIFAPVAILIGRYMRRFKWFPIHAAIMVLVAALVVTCFGLGVYATGSPAFQDTHHKVGLALLIIVVLQVALGAIAHKSRADRPAFETRVPTLTSKSPLRLLHIPLGLGIVGLGFFQVNEGFDEWESSSDRSSEVPNSVRIVFWIVLGVVAAAYVIGWLLEVLGRLNRPRADSFDEREMSPLQLPRSRKL